MPQTRGRALVGQVVRDEIARKGLTQGDVAQEAGLTRDTIYRVINGRATVSQVTLRRIEGVLGLPRNLLEYVERGDVDRIQRTDMDADLQRSIVELITSAEDEPPAEESRRRRRGA